MDDTIIRDIYIEHEERWLTMEMDVNFTGEDVMDAVAESGVSVKGKKLTYLSAYDELIDVSNLLPNK